MISSLRISRVSPDRAESLSLARLDYALSDGPLAQGTVMDPRIVNPQLEEIVSEAVRRAETERRAMKSLRQFVMSSVERTRFCALNTKR